MKNKHKIRELCKSLAIFLTLVSCVLLMVHTVAAQDLQDTLGEVNKGALLPGFGSGADQGGPAHSNASYQPGASGITSALFFIIDLLKYGMATIAVMVIIASGVRLVTAGRMIDEISGPQKENMKYAAIGLVVIMIADTLVKNVFFGEQGEVFRSEADAQLAAERGSEELRGIYSFIGYALGTLAILMIVIAGVRLVTSAGNEEVVTKQKKQVGYAVAGLILVGISELLVKDIIFPQQGSQLSDVNRARELIVQMTNFLSSFIATVAIAMFMYGGFLYVVDTGKEEQTAKAKKVFAGAAIGLIVALAAFAIVNTFVKFETPADVPSFENDVILNPVTE